MTGKELIDLMLQAKRRIHVIGDAENGIIVALDLEGRLFAVLNGRVLNRVVPPSILNRTNKKSYLNPGGDALWPAPEGSIYGYEYGTGEWRVPPSVTSAVWELVEQQENMAVIRTEIDLINNYQLGIPCEFERRIRIEYRYQTLIQFVTEVIRYIGSRTLSKNEFRLVPWSLCQFDSGQESKVIMLPTFAEDIWDLYDSSLLHRGVSGDSYVVRTKTDFRFQLGLSKRIPWIEFISGRDFQVKRYTRPLPFGQKYIDIADIHPKQMLSARGVKLSIYCDPSGFVEIEACGGCPDILMSGTELSVDVITEYQMI